MTDNRLEQLSALEHDQWIEWTRYMLTELKPVLDPAIDEDYDRAQTTGEMSFPPWLQAVHRWTRQLETPYERLSEKEKESDRVFARRVLDLLQAYAEKTPEEATPSLEYFALQYHTAWSQWVLRALSTIRPLFPQEWNSASTPSKLDKQLEIAEELSEWRRMAETLYTDLSEADKDYFRNMARPFRELLDKHAYVYDGRGNRQQLSPLLSNLLYAAISMLRSRGSSDITTALHLNLMHSDETVDEAIKRLQLMQLAKGPTMGSLVAVGKWEDKSAGNPQQWEKSEEEFFVPGVVSGRMSGKVPHQSNAPRAGMPEDEVKRLAYEKEGFYAGARAFFSDDAIVRVHQEAALQAAYNRWRNRHD